MRRIVRYCGHRGGVMASTLRKLWFRMIYPDILLGPGVTLSRGAVLACFDGGSITIGGDTIVGRDASIEAKGGHIRIGGGGLINQGSVIVAVDRIDIGRDALIGEYVTVRDQDHRHADSGIAYSRQGSQWARVAIGDNVWLGAKCTVTRGVKIGDGAVVGANAVVTRDLEAGGKFGGVPARSLDKEKSE